MSKTKSLFLALAFCLVLPVMFVFAGCNDGPKEPQDAQITINVENKVYDGQVIAVTATTQSDAQIVYEYKEASAGDEAYSQTAPKDAGTYIVRAKTDATENYNAAQSTKEFSITQKSVTLEWTAPESLVYSKTAKVPTVAAVGVVAGDTCSVNAALKDGDDNINVGEFTYIASINNSNYKISGNTEEVFEITQKHLTIEWTAPASLVYSKTEKVPTVAITGQIIDGDECIVTATLNQGNDNVNVGTFYYTATFSNPNYRVCHGAVQGYTITAKPLQLNWIDPANLVYSKEAKIATASISGVEDGDECIVTATLNQGDDNINVGTFTYSASINNNNYVLSGSAEKTYTITAKPVTIEWTAPASLVYSKSAKIPDVEILSGVIDGDSCEVLASLKAGNDNINVGTFAFIAGLNNANYAIAAEEEKSYTITKAHYSIIRQQFKRSDEQVWRGGNTTFTYGDTVIFNSYCDGGEEIEGEITYVEYYHAGYTTGIASVNGNQVTAAKYGTVYIQTLIAECRNYYQDESNGVQGITFQGLVPQEGEQYVVPTGLTATYGDTLGSIALPTGFNWFHDTASLVGDVGVVNKWAVTFYPSGEDENIYVPKNNIPVSITVNKANAVFAPLVGLEIPYNTVIAGNACLPAGYAWSGSRTADTLGEQTWPATYNPDINNYNEASGTITVTVVKANPEYVVPTGLTAEYGQVLQDVVGLTTGFAWQDDAALTSVGDLGDNEFMVTFTPTDTTNYNIITDIPVTVTVSKGTPEYVVPTGLTAKYGQVLQDVSGLTTGFTWQDDAVLTPVGDLGDNEFLVTFTPTDTTHYNVIEDIPVTVTVTKGDGRILVQTSTIAADGQPITLSDFSIDVLGDGAVTLEFKDRGADDSTYSTTGPSSVGQYTVRATVAEGTNYLAAVTVADFQIVDSIVDLFYNVAQLSYYANHADVIQLRDMGKVLYIAASKQELKFGQVYKLTIETENDPVEQIVKLAYEDNKYQVYFLGDNSGIPTGNRYSLTYNNTGVQSFGIYKDGKLKLSNDTITNNVISGVIPAIGGSAVYDATAVVNELSATIPADHEIAITLAEISELETQLSA